MLTMKKYLIRSDKATVSFHAFFIYIWMTRLSVLSVTDTYFSVYLLCGVVALLCLYDNYKDRRTCNSRQRVVLLVFSALFSIAVLFANYPLFEPMSVLQNLFDTVCCFLGGLFVANPILLFLLKRLPLQKDFRHRNHPFYTFAFVFVSIAAIDLLYLFFVQYPGVLTRDSITTIQQIMGDVPYDNVMPFWHTVTVKPFIILGLHLFGNMNAAVACFHVAQILFMAACFAYVLVSMYQSGIPNWFIVATYLIYAIQPYNIVYSVTLWKDIPFAGAAVLLVTSFYRILKEIGKSKISNYIVFIIGAIGFSLWRTNGWYAFLATVLIMLILLRKEKKMLLFLMVIVLLICWVLINPVLDVLEVGGTNFAEAFAVPMQQIARVVSEGRELSEEETALLSKIFCLDKVGQMYDPKTVDPVKFETFRYDQIDFIRENLGDYLRLYFSIGMRYPGDYFKAWIEETKGYWNGGYFFWIYTKEVGNNSYGIQLMQSENLIARCFAAAFRYLEKPVFLQPLTSIGLHVWTLIICCVVNALKKREEFMLSIPLLVLVVGLWLGAPVYAEFRYAYPIFLTMPIILSVTLFHSDVSRLT